MIADWNFLRSFGYIFFVPALSIIPGIAIGLGFGFLILPHEQLARTTIPFLRVALWLPFLVYWTLPFWPLREPSLYEPIRWIAGTSIVAVALVSCHDYLISQSILQLKWNEARQLVIYGAVQHAILISLFSQFWLPDWFWRLAFKLESVSVLYGMLFLLILFLFLVERMFGSSFEQVSEIRKAVIITETQNPTWQLFLTSALLVVVSLLFWQSLSAFALFDLMISPLEVPRRMFDLLTYPRILQGQSHTIWGHMGVSLIEISCGLVLSIGLVLITVLIVLSNPQLRHFLVPLLPLTYATSLVLPSVVILWQVLVLPSPVRLLKSPVPLHTILFVASASYFPLLRLMWALRRQPLIYRVAMAVIDVLPLAFVGMVFGEAFGAVSGLGFFVQVSAGRSQTVDRISACFLIVGLLAITTFTFQWLAKRVRHLPLRDRSHPELDPILTE